MRYNEDSSNLVITLRKTKPSFTLKILSRARWPLDSAERRAGMIRKSTCSPEVLHRGETEETVRKIPEVPPMPSAKLVFAEPPYGIADILEHGSVGQFHSAKTCVLK